MIRLDKYLADMGAGTRSELKKAIRSGRVCVDGTPVKKPEFKLDETTQEVTLDAKRIAYHKLEYYMLHKPAGVVSATRDSHDPTVLDLITGEKRKDLFPVGRLDKDTEGLLLITNDGELAHRLLSPAHHVDKVYFARIDKPVLAEDIEAFASGLDIGDEDLTLPAKLEVLRTLDDSGAESMSDEKALPQAQSEIRITIQEGRYHQVKRMFEAVDKRVLYLKRLSMGSLTLDESLEKGAYRTLTEEELEALC